MKIKQLSGLIIAKIFISIAKDLSYFLRSKLPKFRSVIQLRNIENKDLKKCFKITFERITLKLQELH